MSQIDRELGRVAAARGIATAEAVETCLQAAKDSPVPVNLAQVMVSRGVANQRQIEELLKEVGATEHQPAAERVRLGANSTFGRYQILDELGRGGMGAVYKAQDKELDRVVALKILSDRLVATDEDVHRFRRESKLAARLKHPYLVPVYEAGIIDGVPYFTMEYIDGATLDSVFIDSLAMGFRPDFKPRLGRDELVRVMIKVAEGVHVAHRAGIIHRDLKPANIILDAQNEPHVMDFGLAKEVNSRTWLTTTGIAMGTPYYMPPEQARGEVRDLDLRADVYALGAVLYHGLTLKLPFMEASGAAVLRKVIDEDPTLPRAIDPTIDRKLERIVLKAMAKERRDRYPTAGDFARDLERFLSGQPISAKPPSVKAIVKRWARRNPAVAAALAVAILMAAFFGGYLFLRPGRLTIETVPDGAEVFIDGSSVAGKTPIREMTLFRGRHEVRVSKPGFREERMLVDMGPGGREVRPLKLEPREGRLTLESVPPKVEVQLTGPKRLSAKTPIDALTIAEGKYKVEAFHEGCQRGVFSVEVRDRVELTQKFSLLPAKRWVARVGDAVYRRVALSDLDSDGIPDAIAASADGRLRAVSGKTGRELWTHDSKYKGPTEPALLDADGDGHADIFVGIGASGFQCLKGDGSPRYTVKLPSRAAVSPDSVDVDGDGIVDPLTAGWDGVVSCYSGKALLSLKADRLWTAQAGGRIDGAPAIGDFDPAEGLEALVVTEKQRAAIYRLSTGDEVRSFDLPKVPMAWRVGAGWLVCGGEEFVMGLPLTAAGTAWTQPASGTVTAISTTATVVIVATDEGAVSALDAATGAEQWKWRAEQAVRSTPVVGDLDGDGEPEVAFGCDSARLHVLDARGGLPRWHFAAGDKVQGEPSIADLTGDGLPELVFGTGDGRVYAVSLSSR